MNLVMHRTPAFVQNIYSTERVVHHVPLLLEVPPLVLHFLSIADTLHQCLILQAGARHQSFSFVFDATPKKPYFKYL